MEAEGGGGGSARVKGEAEESTAIRTSRRSKRISKKQGRTTGTISLKILKDDLHILLLSTHHLHYDSKGTLLVVHFRLAEVVVHPQNTSSLLIYFSF